MKMDNEIVSISITYPITFHLSNLADTFCPPLRARIATSDLSYVKKVWHGFCKEPILRMIIIIVQILILILIIINARDFENDYHYDNRKVYKVKVVLMCAVLLTYRCVCFGMVIA